MNGTLLEALEHQANARGEAPAFRVKRHGVWQTTSWLELRSNVYRLAQGLGKLGLEAGQVLAIMGPNSPEWVTAELAAQALGAVPIGIPPDALAEEVGQLLEFTSAKAAVVADEEQLDKLVSLQDRLSFVLVWRERGMNRHFGHKVKPYSSLLADATLGPTGAVAPARIGAETTALLSATSGKAGASRLAMLSHGQLLAAERAIHQRLGLKQGEWLFSGLPLSSILEQLLTLVQALTRGLVVHFPEDAKTVREDLKEVQPDFFLSSANLWEEAAALIESRMQDARGLKKSVGRWGMKVLREATLRHERKVRLGVGLEAQAAIAYFMVARPIRARLGLGACKVAVTSGAPVSLETFVFFRALGVDLRQLYGQPETAGAACAHQAGDTPPETVGTPLYETQVRISTVGEIEIKAPQVFSGYFKDQALTQERFTQDGFFKTGDSGFFDRKGRLVVLGDLKQLFELQDGTRLAPEVLENRLKSSPYIREAVVIGHGRSFISALIEVDPASTQRWARKAGIGFTSYQSLAAREEVYQLISKEIARILPATPDSLRVRRFAVLPKELHPDDGEVTRSHKVRRGVITERYAPLIEAIYAGVAFAKVTLPIRYAEGQGGLEAVVRISDLPAQTFPQRQP